jgi:hypothetical protein
MTFNIGVPQVVWIVLMLVSLVINCVYNGRYVQLHWYSSVISLMAQIIILIAGGFFS